MPASRIVLIRAVNVGGTGKLPMAQLRSIATELGATDVRTHIASGNLLCTPPDDEFDRRLEAEIEKRFGFFRDVISRSRSELEAALAAHPFEVGDASSFFVSFLTAAPDAHAIEAAATVRAGDDRWMVIGRDLHIAYAVSAGRPELNVPALMRTLAVAGTARNLLTVRKLLELTS